jgi:DNA-binding transcriptional LysR family regulator
MDLGTDQLRTFIQVCEQGSFSKAAQTLGISQSTISTQIATLEKQAGLSLFDRSQRPVKLTEAGIIFSRIGAQIINQTEQLDKLMRELSGGIAGEVKIGTTTSIGAFILPRIVSRLLQESPKIRLDVTIKPLSSICESVRQGETDFGLVLSQTEPRGLEAKILKRERLCFVVSPRHPLAETTVRLEDLKNCSFVVGAKSGGYTAMIERLLERNGLFGFDVALRVGSFEAIKETVRAGLGVGLLPHFMIRRELTSGVLSEITVKGKPFFVEIIMIDRVKPAHTPTLVSVQAFIEGHFRTAQSLA